MSARYFGDLAPGDRFVSPRRTITEADVINFAGVSGDFYPLHTDEEFAKKSIFGSRVAHGLLTLAICSGLWMRLGVFEGTLVALSGIDRLRFTKPVYIGDSLTATLTVTAKEERGEHGLVIFKNEVTNQKEEVVLVFDATILMAKKPRATASEGSL